MGDLVGNVAKIVEFARRAHSQGAQVVLTPELSLCGYPPEDLLLRPAFMLACRDALADCAKALTDLRGLHVVVGHPHQFADQADVRTRSHAVPRRHNAASVLTGGHVIATYCKRELPNYQVFDERRYFASGRDAGLGPVVFEVGGLRFGLLICEDAWFDEPARSAKAAGAQVLCVLNASPYHLGKVVERELRMGDRARDAELPLLYAHLTGGQDEVVFDGASFAVDAAGRVMARAPMFEESLLMLDVSAETVSGSVVDVPCIEAQAWAALVTGVRDYIGKNGFPGALIGLSGGVDSALVLAIAVDALGADKVHLVRPQSVDGDRQHQGRVDTAAQADQRARETVLSDVVAHACHQRRPGLRLDARHVDDAAGHGLGRHVQHQQRFFEHWRARHDPARRIDRERRAVEHHLVLPAGQVGVQQRQLGVARAVAHAQLAFNDLAQVVRRRVQHAQHLCPGGLGGSRRLVEPGVFADQQAEAQAADLEHDRPQPRIAARGEVATLVEHLVVRQLALAIGRDDVAAGQHRRRVVAPGYRMRSGADIGLIGKLMRVPDHHMQAAQIGQCFRAIGQRVATSQHEGWAEQQVFGRIAAQAQLRGQHHLRALRMRTARKLDDLRDVADQVAHGRVDLSERNFDQGIRRHVQGGTRGRSSIEEYCHSCPRPPCGHRCHRLECAAGRAGQRHALHAPRVPQCLARLGQRHRKHRLAAAVPVSA